MKRCSEVESTRWTTLYGFAATAIVAAACNLQNLPQTLPVDEASGNAFVVVERGSVEIAVRIVDLPSAASLRDTAKWLVMITDSRFRVAGVLAAPLVPRIHEDSLVVETVICPHPLTTLSQSNAACSRNERTTIRREGEWLIGRIADRSYVQSIRNARPERILLETFAGNQRKSDSVRVFYR